MDYDEVTRTHRDATGHWISRIAEYKASGIEKLASTYNNGESCECVRMRSGAFNMCFKVVFDTTREAWAVRFPIPGKIMYPDEKIRREAAIMNFLRQNTRIPTPKVIAFGTAADNHDPSIGPFIITEWIEGITLDSVMEKIPEPKWGPTLREDISDDTLYKIYSQMARIHLELSLHDFDKIGSLSEVKDEGGRVSWSVTSRPMTLKMNEIESKGYVKMDDHSLAPFSDVTEYLKYSIQQNTDHLFYQRNSVDDSDDARHKYKLRRQARSIIPRFVSNEYDSGPFRLFCDDLHPRNVIVDPETLEILALIDLEWTYVAPYQFLFSPPTWLILEKPISWTIYGTTSYHEKFLIFIKSLEDEEARMEKEGRLKIAADQKHMSTLMRQSLKDGKFWFMELLSDAFNFDGDVIWPTIRGFLQIEELDVLDALGETDREEMEAFVKKKMEDLVQYQLDLQSLESSAEPSEDIDSKD